MTRDRLFDDDRSLLRSLMSRLFGRHPRDSFALIAALFRMSAILVKSLYLQPGPHPAPIFRIKPRPVSVELPGGAAVPIPRPRPTAVPAAATEPAAPVRPRAEIIADMQRELSRHGFYDGPSDGIAGPKTDAAIRDFEQSAGLKPTGEPTEELLRALTRSPVRASPRSTAIAPRTDPIAELIAPSAKRVLAVQRALSDFGYGPVKQTGVLGPETRAAIEKFERDRKQPITGEVSDRLMRELAAMSGRPLE